MTAPAGSDATVAAIPRGKADSMSQRDPYFAVLETKFATMSDNIAHIRATVDSLVQSLAQLPAMEEKSRGQSEAISRAFDEIRVVKSQVAALDEARQKERDRVNRWVYGLAGGALVVSVFWSVLGVAFTDNVRSVMRTNEEMRVFLAAQQYQRDGYLALPRSAPQKKESP